MNLDHDFFQVSKLNEDQKKNVATKNGTLFSPNSSGDLRSDAHQSQIIGGNADENHTQIFGGIQLNYCRIYPPLGFGTPACTTVRLPKETKTSSKSLFANKRTTLYYTVGKNRFCA